jgi:putative transposase
LWEGRFRSCLAQSAHYVLGCYRYIELNPVRAAMVDHPSGYLWSSYAVNSGMRSDPLLIAHPDFIALASSPQACCAAYRALVDQELDPKLLQVIRDATNSGYPLASEPYKTAVLSPLGWKMQPGKPGPRVESPGAVYAVES